jgi:transcription antitermination protein NusB
MESSDHMDGAASKRAKNNPGKLTADGRLKAAHKSPRTRSREFAVQALYQRIVGKQDAASLDAFTRGLAGFDKCDSAHYDALVHGCIQNADDLDRALSGMTDRPWAEISPIEHCILWIGAYELQHCVDVPWRVIINECIELAKEFGGTDGHKWVNGVLNKVAPVMRAEEVAADGQARAKRPPKEPPPAQEMPAQSNPPNE